MRLQAYPHMNIVSIQWTERMDAAEFCSNQYHFPNREHAGPRRHTGNANCITTSLEEG